MKKYELTDQIKTIRNEHTLHQIRALIDIPRYGVKAGDLGGWIETENNLSHEGDCWVGDNACVYVSARVGENAWVRGYAWVGGSALVDGDAWVSGNAWIKGNARVEENAQVEGSTRVSGYAWVMGHAHVRNGVIKSTQDYLVVGPIGSRDDYTTFYRTKTDIWVACGCFNSSIAKFEQAVKATHGDNHYAQEYLEAIELAKTRSKRWN